MAPRGTKRLLEDAGIPAQFVHKLNEGRPNIPDVLVNGEVQLLINTPDPTKEATRHDGYIRRAAIRAHVPYMTTMAAAHATALGIIAVKQKKEGPVRSLQDLHAGLRQA